MRLIHSSILTAIAGLALIAGPALAHQAPVAGADYAAHSEAPLPPMHPDIRHDMPPQPDQPRMGYSAEERDGWLAECAHRLGGNGNGPHGADGHGDGDIGRARAECENYLARYEASQSGYAQGQTWSYGAGYAQLAGTPNCGTGCAYPAAPLGMMWVPVALSGGQNCCCQQKPKMRTIVTEEEVPEKVVSYAAPPKVVRTKYTKTVPVKQIKPIKSTK